MYDAECMPKNYVSIFDTGIAIGNPFWNTFGRLARGLGDMPARRMYLIIVVYKIVRPRYSEAVRRFTSCNVDGMSREPGTLPNQTTFLR